MKTHSAEYVDYLSSFDWHLKRLAVLKRAGNKCERCGRSGSGPCGGVVLQIHHVTYDNLGDEPLEDLLAVCEDCHKKEDVKRAAQGRARPEMARLNGWATKKYGEDWDLDHLVEDVEEEFEEWLESRDEDY